MSQNPETSPTPALPTGFSNRFTLLFTGGVCIVCAVILSLLASQLQGPQVEARDLDQNEQMLIAAKFLSPDKHFLVASAEGQYVPANFDAASGALVACESASDVRKATPNEIERLVQSRIRGVYIDQAGQIREFASDEEEKHYVLANQKIGYAQLAQKLLYLLMPNLPETQLNPATAPEGYLIPINGFGLWGPIYGYLALGSDGDTVIGTTWYLHGETPGLGANISEPEWQAQFVGKRVFQRQVNGEVNPKTAPLGITVAKGAVRDVYGTSPLAMSAVDGMSGSTLTGNGVSAAYKSVLSEYRPFLIDKFIRSGASPKN